MSLLSDEERIKNHLMELRGNARLTLSTLESISNIDARHVLEGAAQDDLETARALHRILMKLNVRGVGALDY